MTTTHTLRMDGVLDMNELDDPLSITASGFEGWNGDDEYMRLCEACYPQAVQAGLNPETVRAVNIWPSEGEHCYFCPHVCYVSVYLEDQAYGGPEEGGWYYRCGEPIVDPRNTVASSIWKAKRLSHDLQVVIDAELNEGRRDINSVLSEGMYYVRVDVDTFPAPFPDSLPHYE